MSDDAAPDKTPSRAWIRQLVDFGALVAFAAAFFVTRDLIKAGWVLVVASAIALVVGYLIEKRVAPLPAFMGIVALIFGILAIVFKDPTFIKLKFTVQNGTLALILLGSLPFKKYPFKLLFGEVFPITDAGWRGLTLRYGFYFAAMAGVNELIWRTQSDATWVKFRISVFFIAAAFGALQIYLMREHLILDKDAGPASPDPGL